MDKIYLDQDGYENYLKEIEQIREKIRKNSSDISEYMGDDAYGDGWHDNFAYEQAIKKENYNVVEIGSIVEIEIDGEREIYKLTGSTSSNLDNDIPEITLNSLLGKSIYKKKIGDSFSYTIDKNKIEGKIICIK